MKKHLGQYFTSNAILLQKVKEFTLNTTGCVLEPSCGAGNIVEYLVNTDDKRDFICVEIDKSIEYLNVMLNNPKVQLIQDNFLTLDLSRRFSTIVGNPPYVKQKGKRNIYIDFVDRCLDLLEEQGELIFIIPSDFFTITSASSVKNKLMENGTITHVYYPNDECLFKNATQDVVIFRYQRGNTSRTVLVNGIEKSISFQKGNIYFTDNDKTDQVIISDIFDIKVGMVSGADSIFRNDIHGNVSIITNTGKHKYIWYNQLPNDTNITTYLNKHKETLMSRRIRKFNETNWFQWGCPRNIQFMEQNVGKECIYAATITRKKPVFSKGIVNYFDGSLLCLYPKESLDIEKAIEYMNTDKFLSQFLFAGRYKLGQKSLSDYYLPKSLVQEMMSNQ